MDRVQLKMDAKAAMQQANPHPVLVALVYMVILAAISFVISMMSGVSSVFYHSGIKSGCCSRYLRRNDDTVHPAVPRFHSGNRISQYGLYRIYSACHQPAAGRHQRFVCLCQILSENLGPEYCYGLLRICMVTASVGSRNHCHVPLFPGSLHICGKSG